MDSIVITLLIIIGVMLLCSSTIRHGVCYVLVSIMFVITGILGEPANKN